MALRFVETVGVAPGTTTLQLGRAAAMPYQDLFQLRAPMTTARIRWDIIGVMGGGALTIALLTGLIASSLK